MACRHKTGTALCICCFSVMILDLMPPRDFGYKSAFLHPKVSLITKSNTCIPKLSFSVATDYISISRAYIVLLLKGNYLHHSHCFHFALCVPFWPVESAHPSYFMKAFIPSSSQRAVRVENKCVLLRAECGLLEPTQAGSC